MSRESLNINDRRSFIFTIDRRSEPVYQVESQDWARAEHRWSHDEIPPELRAKIAELAESGKPGAFVRFPGGEEGVYVICEKNIKPIPELAGDDLILDPSSQPPGERRLSPYDLVICAIGGAICADNGNVFETGEGEYYVIRCQAWGRFVQNQALRPKDVETTKEVLLLLEKLHGKGFLSMSPDPSDEVLPGDMPESTVVSEHVNCYVLNLSRFAR